MKKKKISLFLFLLFFLSSLSSVTFGTEFQNKKMIIKFNNQSAKISSLKILNESMTEPYEMLSENKSNFGLEGTIGGHDLEFWTNKAGGWKIIQKSDEIIFQLKSQNIPFELNKFWKFNLNSYEFDLSYELTPKINLINTNLYVLLGPGIGEKPKKGFGVTDTSYSYTDLIYKTNEVKTKRLSNKNDSFIIKKDKELQWAGLHSRYFLFLFKLNDNFSEIHLNISNIYHEDNLSLNSSLKINLPFSNLNKNNKYKNSFQIFAGTKTKIDLSASDTEEVLFFSLWDWMRYLIFATMTVLYWINNFISNWAISIIILAVLIRIALQPIAKKAIKSQEDFAKLQKVIEPQIKVIKDQFKGAEQSERILNIYNKHKTSPLAGLKPLIVIGIQIPVFVALYHLLGQTFELKEANFLWINSLAEPDKFFKLENEIFFFGSYFNLLPVLMTITNLLTIKLNSLTTDDNKNNFSQNLILILSAVGFFMLFYSFPSGMVLYWTVANFLNLGYIFIYKKKIFSR